MQGIGGAAPSALAAMYALTTIVLIFTLLRCYTRIVVVKSYGMDDHVYVLAFLLLLLYTVFIHVAASYGFGQNMGDIPDPLDISAAVLYECIAQTFAVIGMAVAKWSLGLFLLRLVKETWHKVLIWATLANLMTASLLCLFFFWFQCEPAAFLWDKSLTGKCELPQLEVSIYLGTSCVFTDLFFAVFPWIFMWKLQMNQREKLVILASMSLGVIAGACGIKRATEIPKLMSANYLRDSVGIIVWSAAEMAVTLICIGIPVCRPLYKKYLDKITSRNTSSRYKNISAGAMPLRTIGGSEIPGSGLEGSTSRAEKAGGLAPLDERDLRSDSSLGLGRDVGAGGFRRSEGQSDEDTLTDAYRQRQSPVDDEAGIRVTKDVTIHRG